MGLVFADPASSLIISIIGLFLLLLSLRLVWIFRLLLQENNSWWKTTSVAVVIVVGPVVGVAFVVVVVSVLMAFFAQ